jgi:hypothetical protein
MDSVESMAADEPASVFPPPGTQPIISPDRRWIWTGTAWVQRTPPNAPPIAVAPQRADRVCARTIVVGLVWLALLIAPALYVLVRDGNVTDRGGLTLLTLGFVAIAATLRFGSYTGVRSCGFLEVLAAAAVGAIAVMSIYLIAWLPQPDPNYTNDNAAGVGLVIIGPPVFLIVLTLLGAGALTGRAISRRHPVTPNSRHGIQRRR